MNGLGESVSDLGKLHSNKLLMGNQTFWKPEQLFQ